VKTCSKCGETKPLDNFNMARNAPDGKQRWCRNCQSDHAKQYAKTHPERNRANANRYHHANRDTVLPKLRANYQRNKTARLKATKQWRLENPEKRAASRRRRRARKRATVPQRWQVYDIVPFCCYWCGTNLRAYGATTHVDHVMPISLGGPADPTNEVNTCAACNLNKNAKHPLVWIADLVTN
jgi:hypothetical protein